MHSVERLSGASAIHVSIIPLFGALCWEIGSLGLSASARRRVTFRGSLIMQRENRVCRVPETAAASLPRPTVPSFFVCVARPPIPLSCARSAIWAVYEAAELANYSFTASLELLQALVQASAPEQSSVQLI